MKVYIKVDATKELPEKEGTYNVFFKHIPNLAHPCIFNDGKFSVANSDAYPVQYYLKEIDLYELMIEYATQYYADIRKAIEGNSFAIPCKEGLLKKFLEEKGYIQL